MPLTLFAKALIVDVNPQVRWANAILGSTRSARAAADHDGRPPGADDPPPVRSDGPWAADPGTSMMNPSPGET